MPPREHVAELSQQPTAPTSYFGADLDDGKLPALDNNCRVGADELPEPVLDVPKRDTGCSAPGELNATVARLHRLISELGKAEGQDLPGTLQQITQVISRRSVSLLFDRSCADCLFVSIVAQQ